jgi:16S rRNA (adenine(1408)-N(1))-methyltransferase
MTDSSRRAARPEKKGGRLNALFVVASAERPPAELLGLADELTIAFPWGSLLRGALGIDGAAARGIASLLRPGGVATILLSVAERDALDLPTLDGESAAEIEARWSAFGPCAEGFRAATPAEVAATRSTWARRLSAGRDRAVWRLDLTLDSADRMTVADAS